jgi:hypothetical protein
MSRTQVWLLQYPHSKLGLRTPLQGLRKNIKNLKKEKKKKKDNG